MMKSFRKGRVSDAEIVQWLTDLRGHCYVPESGFCATAVFRARLGGAQDYYFGGVNVENIDHRLATHAEEACIAAMVAGLGRRAEIVEGWVMGAPVGAKTSDALASCCGKCRQQIAGFADSHAKIHSVSLSRKKSTTTVGSFLPDAFMFDQYLSGTGKTEKAPVAELSYEDVRNRMVRQSALSKEDIFRWLEETESVDYASKVSQSVVLRLSNGSYVAGSKVEEAAFISINAAQSAVAIAVSEFGASLVREAWVYARGRGEKELPPGGFGMLPMSALQTLLQVSEHGDIPIHFLADDGDVIHATLSDAAKMAPTSAAPFYERAS